MNNEWFFTFIDMYTLCNVTSVISDEFKVSFQYLDIFKIMSSFSMFKYPSGTYFLLPFTRTCFIFRYPNNEIMVFICNWNFYHSAFIFISVHNIVNKNLLSWQ